MTHLLLTLDDMLQCNSPISLGSPNATRIGANFLANAPEDATWSNNVSTKEDKIRNLDTYKHDND